MGTDMLLAIVRRHQAKAVMEAARKAGATGGTINSARGTASNTILAALGLGDSYMEVLTSFVRKEDAHSVFKAAQKAKAKGMLLLAGEGGDMGKGWTLVEVICEEGFSEEIMAVARKAGAKGGTVVDAHGTSTEADVKFFGSPLVPEKEILMIVLEDDTAARVIEAIEGMEVLKKRGRAVIFSVPVREFSTLG